MKTENLEYIAFAWYNQNNFIVQQQMIFCKEEINKFLNFKSQNVYSHVTGETNFNKPSGDIWFLYAQKDVHKNNITQYKIINLSDIPYLYSVAPSIKEINFISYKAKEKGKSPKKRFKNHGKFNNRVYNQNYYYFNESFGNFTKQEYKHNITCIEEGVKFNNKRKRGNRNSNRIVINGWKDNTKCKHQWQKNIKKHPNNKDVFNLIKIKCD